MRETSATMLAAVVAGPDRLEVLEVPAPRPAHGQAVVGVHTAGICGTDLTIVNGGIPVTYPRVLGHEMVGEVLEPAAGGRLDAGTRVLLDPSVSCGVCRRCRRGRSHLCGNGGLMGRDFDGTFAEQVAVAESQLLPLPDEVPFEVGPLLQILGTCVHGQDLVCAEPGDVGVVVGLGVSGLLQVQLLRARGVDTIIGISRSVSKLELATRLGATHVAEPDAAEELVAEVTAGEGADIVIECSGVLAGVRTAVAAAGYGAQVLMFGTLSAVDGPFPWYDLYAKELDLVSSRAAPPGSYAAAIEHVAAGRIDPEPVLAATFPLADAPQALALFQSGALKVTIRVGA